MLQGVLRRGSDPTWCEEVIHNLVWARLAVYLGVRVTEP